jgi:hypothetical protein
MVVRTPPMSAFLIRLGGSNGLGMPPPGLMMYCRSGCTCHPGISWIWYVSSAGERRDGAVSPDLMVWGRRSLGLASGNTGYL